MDSINPFRKAPAQRPCDDAADLGEHQMFAKLMALTGMANETNRLASGRQI
jgi:hypothetical protein